MSSKHHRYRQKQNFPWLWVSFGGFLIIAAIFLFARRADDGGGGTPSISVDQQRIDFGDVRFGETRVFTVEVTNNGNGKLRFEDKPYIEVLEGC